MSRPAAAAVLRDGVDDILDVARALHGAGAPVGRIEHAVETLGAAHGLDLQCLAGPTSIQVVHAGRSRLVRVGAAHIDLDVQGRLVAAVEAEVSGVAGATTRAMRTPGPLHRSTLGELGVWCLLALSAAIGMGGSDGTVVTAGILGAAVGGLVASAERRAGAASLVPLAGAALVSAGAGLLSVLWSVDVVMAPLAAILVLLPGWSLTVGVAEVATGHLASGAARLTGALVTVLLLALGWAAGAQAVSVLGLDAAAGASRLATATLPSLLGILGVAGCFALLFRVVGRQWVWVAGAVLVAWLASQLPGGPMVRSFAGALAIGLLGACLSRYAHLPGQLATVPGVMFSVPGGALLAAVVQLVDHDPAGLTAFVDAVGVAGALVGGLLTARLLVPPLDERTEAAADPAM